MSTRPDGAGTPPAAPADQPVGAAYDASAVAWAEGPDRVLYDPLARVLVHHVLARLPTSAVRFLDLGCGTGAVSRAATSSGALVVATDLAPGMLRHARWGATTPPCVTADVLHLPFTDAAFDVAVAGFLLNHLPDPASALTEAARVVRPGGWVAASTFHADWSHPVKQAVDDAAARLGFRHPAWYRSLKACRAPRVGAPTALTRLARACGLARVRVEDRVVEAPVHGIPDLVAWRLGMAHLAPFVAGLSPTERQALVDDAVARCPPRSTGLRPRVLLLSAQVRT